MRSWPAWLGAILGVAALLVGLASSEVSVEQWSAATRYTARIGFPFLILAYVARPLVDLTRSGWAKAVLQKRKYLGLGFVMSHSVHLVAIVMLFRTLGEAPTIVQVVFGGFAYVLLYAMALTSNRTAMQALGARWKLLHGLGIHYLWIIFAQSYLKRIPVDDTMIEGIAGSVIVLGAAAVRFTAWRQQRAKRSVAAAA